ncbi:hypothetical protein Amsp01_092440 [Amycolatopsis sp. NBRC 101858]|uniref:hypothetical protein n=1 Tax=Amycolatopsis sp. NBRC 101858 TaxID=3032200 RepID=UPI0024A520C6|nr:hypothetical protein [Amycolatopsis sp. NBRC 101858]GLY43221.1 hypothetical protein Amsp01_092440 [Amycolatopsis sp. NBRC 101858]
MTEELPPALPGEDHKRTVLERTAFGAMVAVLGPGVGFFSALQDQFQPFTGQGPATWVLTLAVLVLAVAAWFLVPRLVKLLRQRRPARAISLVLAVILMVCAAGAGVATAALLGIGGREAAAPPATTSSAAPTSTPSTSTPSAVPPAGTSTPNGAATMTSTSTSAPSTPTPTKVLPPTPPTQAPVAFKFDAVKTVPHCYNYFGDGTQPGADRVVLLVRQAQDPKNRYFERVVEFDGSGRWSALSLVIGLPGDTGPFYLEAYQVTADEANRLEHAPGNVPSEVHGTGLTSLLVVRDTAKDDC